MSTTVQSNTIIWTIFKGTSESLAITKEDGWVYDDIAMDFKSSRNIEVRPFLRLTVGRGLTIEDTSLTIDLTPQDTIKLSRAVIYADIKLRNGTEVLDPILFEIRITDTVTKMPAS